MGRIMHQHDARGVIPPPKQAVGDAKFRRPVVGAALDHGHTALLGREGDGHTIGGSDFLIGKPVAVHQEPEVTRPREVGPAAIGIDSNPHPAGQLGRQLQAHEADVEVAARMRQKNLRILAIAEGEAHEGRIRLGGIGA